ncbi:hypothetical protein BD410DRAFT_760896 [Rickenella mellea]|uniref:Fe2OG dioxygenase domain-containing protein n=1 Tax=Rickenella mellea TaxID=50990 RepID=A0A4Y7QJA9_9AGAM|nr:hypothetical protein BD410DRAFT_760896 [Rickenella mellea]
MSSGLNGLLQPLAEAVTECGQKTPWCSGTWDVSPEDLKLYFDSGENYVRAIRLQQATENHLEDLVKACQPATFGVNDQDVLDESYRKAGKMDTDRFSINFNPERLGLARAIKDNLLGWEDDGRNIVLEQYKLNVYGKGSFFKSHKDTPRGEKMFGSLVVIFPTAHEGGALLLRHDGQETTFDSGKQLKDQAAGTIAFVAFYSDVEHEVQVVTAGHRVTITYNLYFADEKAPILLPRTANQGAGRFSCALKDLLANPEFLPKGGLLGFGLKHQYPLSSKPKTDIGLENLLTCLKGKDAMVLRACTELGLLTSLKIIYNVEFGEWLLMCDKAIVGLDYQVDQVLEDLVQYSGGVAIWGKEEVVEEWPELAEKFWRKIVKWVTPMKSMTTHAGQFVAYGNQAEMAYIYGQISLIVEVGIPGHREDPSTIVPFDFTKGRVEVDDPDLSDSRGYMMDEDSD